MSTGRVAIFLAIALTIMTALHWLLWHRLVRLPEWPSPWAAVGTWAVVSLGASFPLAFLGARLLPRVFSDPLSWVALIWMGASFLLVVLLLPAELLRASIQWWLGRGELLEPARRLFLSRTVALAVIAAGASLTTLAMFTALAAVKVRRLRVALRDLPAPLEGLRVVQLTDIHVGPTIGRSFVEELVRRTNALEPDVVAITGDLVDGSVAELGPAVEPLGELRARHGVFFVTGNHEYYSGPDEWIEYLESLNVRVLRNERVSIEHEGAVFDLAGVDDWDADSFDGHGRDLPKALEGLEEGRKVILLAHQPKQVEEAASMGVDLQLSGHTHGGQIFPFNFLVRLQQPYVVGLHEHRGTKLYVSPGTGYWGPPMRLGVPAAEITQVELGCA